MAQREPERLPVVRLVQVGPPPQQPYPGTPVSVQMRTEITVPSFPPYDYVWKTHDGFDAPTFQHTPQLIITRIPSPGGVPGQIEVLAQVEVALIDIAGHVVRASAPARFQRARPAQPRPAQPRPAANAGPPLPPTPPRPTARRPVAPYPQPQSPTPRVSLRPTIQPKRQSKRQPRRGGCARVGCAVFWILLIILAAMALLSNTSGSDGPRYIPRFVAPR